jgi:hypothetical protein
MILSNILGTAAAGLSQGGSGDPTATPSGSGDIGGGRVTSGGAAPGFMTGGNPPPWVWMVAIAAGVFALWLMGRALGN